MREVDAWAVISYLLAGVIVYGGIGWLLDWWLGTRGFVAVGHRAGVQPPESGSSGSAYSRP